jgi:hypothetical protein
VPVLAITLLQFTLHTLNHLLDIGQAEPSWLGSAKALVLGLATAPWRSLSMWYGNWPHTGPAARAGSNNHDHEEPCDRRQRRDRPRTAPLPAEQDHQVLTPDAVHSQGR